MSKKYYERLSKTAGTSKTAFSSDFGLKILKKFGWEEGKGLGRDLDGTTEHVQVERRTERTGLGAEKVEAAVEAQWDNWWKSAYDTAQKGIGEVEKKEESSDEDSSSDDEDAQPRTSAIKGARFMTGKLRRAARADGTAFTENVIQQKTEKDAKKIQEQNEEALLPLWYKKLRKLKLKREKLLKKVMAEVVAEWKAGGQERAEEGVKNPLAERGMNPLAGPLAMNPLAEPVGAEKAEKKKKKKKKGGNEEVGDAAPVKVEKRKAEEGAEAEGPAKKKKKKEKKKAA